MHSKLTKKGLQSKACKSKHLVYSVKIKLIIKGEESSSQLITLFVSYEWHQRPFKWVMKLKHEGTFSWKSGNVKYSIEREKMVRSKIIYLNPTHNEFFYFQNQKNYSAHMFVLHHLLLPSREGRAWTLTSKCRIDQTDLTD